MATEARTTNYWIASDALYIQLNAMGEPNYIQASVVSGASIIVYMQGIKELGYDAGHNYRRWTLQAYPSQFPDDSKRYIYAAIPRTATTNNGNALIVFPGEQIDIYGKSITDETKQVGSEDYYYVFLQGIISEVFVNDSGNRVRKMTQDFNCGQLATDEALASGGEGQWWQYNSVSDSVSFLKTILKAAFSNLTAQVADITKLILGKHELNGVATENTLENSTSEIVTPQYLGQFGVKHFLAKNGDDEASGIITFLKGIKIGAEKLWQITKDGLAYLSNLVVKGNTQLGENGTSTTFGDYKADSTGAKISVKQDGTSIAEFDYITIRRAADFRSVTIHELRYIGGELAITPAAMQVSRVERLDKDGNVLADDDTTEPNKFKCYFDTTDTKGERKAYNEFVVGDQARCQQFGIAEGTHEFVKTKYYWRLVVEVGENYIVLSNVDKDPLTTSEPSVNDNIVQLGYRYSDQANRQAAIILSATSNDAPSQKYYQGINDYSLDHVVKDEGYDAALGVFHCNVYGDSYTGDKDGQGYFKYDSKTKKATFKGTMVFNSDSTLPDGTSIDTIAKKDDLENLNIKSGNLLRNTSFCGDYESIDISDDTDISEDKEVYSEKLKYWEMDGVSVTDTDDSTSGKAVLIDGTLSQELAQPLLEGNDYVLSFKGKGTTLRISVGGDARNVEMTSSMERYELHVKCSDATDKTFSMAGSGCTVCEIMLSYGTIAPAWSPAYSDNDKSMSEFQNLKFLTDAMTEGSTTIDGGLVMSQQFKVGNFRDKKMVKETGGMSGYYNDDNSPFLWGGGSLEQAIYAIQKYKDDPTYQPTDDELKNMANFVVTHGGRAILNDIILRGIIYAEGGVMKSIKSPNGNFEIDENGNTKLKGEINATKGTIGGYTIDNGFLYNGDYTKWATSDNINMAQLGWNFLRIAQSYSYGSLGITNMKIGIGQDSDPTLTSNSNVMGASAFYIYRRMLSYDKDYYYLPAAKIVSDNVMDRNIAMRLVGGLQVHGGVIETGHIYRYSNDKSANMLDLSFGTTFLLHNDTSAFHDFFFPTLSETRRQAGIDDANTEFCIPITVTAAASTYDFCISSQCAAATPVDASEAGRIVDSNGIWDYTNDSKRFGGNRIGMNNGDSWSFLLVFTTKQGYYIQIVNRQN